MKVFKIILLIVLAPTFAFGQKDKSKILVLFDKFVYYPDSTIMIAYRIKDNMYDGYSIEFNQKGEPSEIGRYLHGKKQWWWVKFDNSSEFYSNGKVTYARCGTGMPISLENEYFKILSGYK